MLTALTKAQEARFPEFVEKWTRIGLCTDPANRPEAEAGIKLAYQIAGLKAPCRIIWSPSPVANALTRATILSSHRHSVWHSVRDSVSDSGFGQHDAEWLGFYDYLREVVGEVQTTEKLKGLWQISHTAGWFIPHEMVCWISERHNVLKRDDHGRLHCVDGLACGYPDGWGVYALHGVRVPEKYVLTPADKMDPADVLKEQNAQVRMAVINKIGFARMLGKLPHKVVSEQVGNSLIEFDLNGQPIRALHLRWAVKGGEAEETVLPVWRTKEEFGQDGPDDPDDFEQVRRWTLGVGKNDTIIFES